MTSAQLKERASALRAEAQSARGEAQEAHFKRRSQLDLERERVATSKATAEYAAREATERADAAKGAAQISATSASSLEQESASAAKKGDARMAQETAESASYARRMQRLENAREQQSTLDAAKFRSDAAAHDQRLQELEFEIRATNDKRNAAEINLDKLEEQSRLYDEAWRKAAAAEAASDDIPRRAELELQAEAAIAAAEAISIDRAAIRVLAPGLPDSTPAVDTAPAADLDGVGDAMASTSPPSTEAGSGGAQLDSMVAAAPAPDDVNDDDVVGDLSVPDQVGSADAKPRADTDDAAPLVGDTSSDRPVDELDNQIAASEPDTGTAGIDAEWPPHDSLGVAPDEPPDTLSDATSMDDGAVPYANPEPLVEA